MPMPQLPRQMHSVERVTKYVTRASIKVFGCDSRHGVIVSTSTSRKMGPKLQSKISLERQDYVNRTTCLRLAKSTLAQCKLFHGSNLQTAECNP
jgi:hypothetical protein